MNIVVGFTTKDEDCIARASLLADQLQLPLLDLSESSKKIINCNNCSDSCLLLLAVTPDRLELRQTIKRVKPLVVDFFSPTMRYRLLHGGGRKQLLAKAIGIRSNYAPSVLDATAGLGKDALVLAALGCAVHMLERSPIIGALLQDGLVRLEKMSQTLLLQLTQATTFPVWSEQNKLAKFLQPYCGLNLDLKLTIIDAATFIGHCLQKKVQRSDADIYVPEVIYLDPMYPVVQRKTALNKEAMRFLKRVVGDDCDIDELFLYALQLATRRVVVKRPRSAPHLAAKKPNIIFRGASCRYDVYLNSKISVATI